LAVNDFLALPLETKPLIKDLLYKRCLECCEQIYYGIVVRENETEAETNLREFGINNREDAYEKGNLHHAMYFEAYESRKNRFITIMFYPAWENRTWMRANSQKRRVAQFL
jgi:hypothetical protein